MAGPDEIMSRGYKLDLPEWKGRSLSELSVGVWKTDDMAPVTKETQARVERVAEAFREEGASIDMEARPNIDVSHSHEVYGRLLQPTMSSRMPEEQYDRLRKQVDALDPDDQSVGAQTMRAQVSSFKDFASANELRHRIRWEWHEFFKRYDVLLTPTMPTPAFKHDHGKFGERRTVSYTHLTLPTTG